MTFSDQSAIGAHYDTAHAQSSGHCRPEHPDARHECEVCGRKVTSKGNLSKHMAIAHGDQQAAYECALCSRSFKVKYYLSKHMKNMHGGVAQ